MLGDQVGMSSFSVTDAALSGVGLLGRRTLAAVVWSALYVGAFGFILLLFGSAIFSFIGTVVQSGGKPNPAAIIGMIGSVGGLYLMLVIVSIVLNGVIVCAVYRAELYPDDSRYFYMRLGASEGWLMLVSFVRGILMFGAQMVMSIPIAVITIATAAAGAAADGHGGNGAGVATLLVTGVLRLAMYVVIVVLYLRFSMAGPMTFVDRKFRLFESWTLTRGHAGSLFLVGLLIGVMGMIAYIVLAIVGVAGGFAIWGGVPHPASAQAFFSQPPGDIMQFAAPFVEWGVLLLFIGAIFMVPISLAPWAHVYRRLRPETDVATVFE